MLLLLALSACGGDDAGDRVGAGTTAPVEKAVSGATAVWMIDQDDPPTDGAVSFVALVSRLECSSGHTGEVREPEVVEEDDRIVVTFEVEPLPPGGYDCPSNPAVPYTVVLRAPIGGRPILDGACRSGEASTTSFCTAGAVRWGPQSTS